MASSPCCARTATPSWASGLPELPFLLAAGKTPEFLAELAGLLVAGTLIAYIGARLGLVPIVGFLLAGVLIGPNALGVVNDREVIDAAAEVGVILLLFTIGMEFSLERLARLWRAIFLGGGLQVGLTTLLSVAVLLALGVGGRAAIYTGLLVALSSTALVLRLLSDRGEIGEEYGSASVGLLLFQDLAIIPMVLLVPALGSSGGSLGEIVAALAIAVAIIGAVLAFARRLMPPLLEVVARTCSPEIFLITVIAICFGTAYLTSLAGVSVALGAFLAGLVVHESRFGAHALSEILPLQIVFSATFFVSIGMLADPGFVTDNIALVLLSVLAVLVIKAVATAASVRALGYSTAVAGASALLLAQVGEFSFVLDQVGRDEGLTPGDLGEEGTQTLIATTVLLMVATPTLSGLGRRLVGVREQPPLRAPDDGRLRRSGIEPDHDLRDHVILAGYGEGARAAVPALRDSGIPFLITTLNPGGAREAIGEGLPVIQGDHTKAALLERAGVSDARLLVVVDDELETTYRVASVARALNPRVEILARVEADGDVAAIADAGVDRVISGESASARRVGAAVLHQCGRASANAALDPDRIVRFEPTGEGCEHTGQTVPVRPSADGCESCLRSGDEWVHLRICLICGHVGCCDSSPNRHASAHFAETGHPLIASAERGENWAYCYIDRLRMRSRSPAREESSDPSR
jgi:CPA2 family monovalent cation:H+ antiporter-2